MAARSGGPFALTTCCQICRLRKSPSVHIVFAELAEVPWQRTWWLQVVGFMQRLANMPQASLQAESLSDNILDALQAPGFDNWAAGVHRQFARLGMASTFLSGRIQYIDAFGFQRAMLDRENEVWAGLHISPRLAPSKKAKLCTYLRWFSRPEWCSVEPYHDLPFSIKKLRSIVHFRMGSYALPVEQGRLDRPAQLCQGICADAPSAPHGLLGMSGIASLIALILVIFGLNMRSFFKRHMVPCVPSRGFRIRSLFVL